STRSGREDPQSSGDDEDEEVEYARQEDIPEGGRDQDLGGDGPGTHDTHLDFFSGADIELARFMEYDGGSGSGSGSQPGDEVPPSHRYGPPSDMYELFSCGEQTMDQIAHGYVASRPADDASFLHTSPQQQYQLPSPHCQTYYQPSPLPSHPSPSWAQPHYQSTVSYHSPSPQPQHDDQAPQVVRPRAQQPQRDCHPPTCGTSSHLHHRPGHEGDRD
ncbi:hypothetical protein PIB30_065269, partial [Stylosanthes scabra]|nr:hypothetical protein [Stylosanthes scabra]